ncbi:hypothetical protein LOB11_08200, partial [Lactobacillus delbrueckii subsp. lactis]|nr:hypothetical protein [Lactobacillus delbrueckii subsp. lactis]
MVLSEISSKEFRDMVRIASHRMSKNVQFVNDLNVFPVPDGDTGTNMNLTMESGEKEKKEKKKKRKKKKKKIMRKGEQTEVRGN